MSGPTCVVCKRPVPAGRVHGGCAPYLALAPADYEPPDPPLTVDETPPTDWRDAGLLAVGALGALVLAVLIAWVRR